jgi:proline iminopeptidase
MKTLYPDLEPYATHRHPRDSHHIHAEECGNPDGIPVLFLHGGPGSGCKPYHRCFFDPARYRIVLLDQRGAGRSAPQGELSHNTTADLVRDIEYLRRELQVERWLLFGGSWGATLALLYAQKHPAKVAGLILRGTFLARRRDLDWFIGAEGVPRIYPEQWEHLLAALPEAERADPLPALYRCLTGNDEVARRRAAREWDLWGSRVVLGEAFDPSRLHEHVSAEMVSQARIELHYAVNRYFLEKNEILDGCGRIAHLPAIIIHGRRDLVCPVEAAWSLHRRLPESALRILPQAGHIATHDAMIDALVEATDAMAERLSR